MNFSYSRNMQYMPDFGLTSISGLENASKYRQAVNAANYLVNDATLNADLALNTAKNQISTAEYAGGQQRQSNIFGSVRDAALSAGSGFAYKSLRTPTRTPKPIPGVTEYPDTGLLPPMERPIIGFPYDYSTYDVA